MSTEENVAAFLVSVSQLSHERTLEDRQRQRDLQRDIDELRRRLKNIPPLKGPKHPVHNENVSVIELSEPTARKGTPNLKPKPRPKPKTLLDSVSVDKEPIDIVKGPSSTPKEKEYRSFSQIEALIKANDSNDTEDNHDSNVNVEPPSNQSAITKPKPLKPVNNIKPLPISREDRLAKHFTESQNKLVIPVPKANYVPKGGYLNLNDKTQAPPKATKPRSLLSGNGTSFGISISPLKQSSGGWLASSLANPKTSATPQNTTTTTTLLSSPGKLSSRKPNDWITSSLNNSASQVQKSPTGPIKPSKNQYFTSTSAEANHNKNYLQGSPKSASSQTSWISSAVKKAEPHSFDDRSTPKYLIPKSISVKSKLLLEKDQLKTENEPEFVNMLLTLKKRSPLPPPGQQTQTQTLEFADKIESMRRSPIRQQQADLNRKSEVEEIPEGLRPKLSPTRRGIPPEKPSKPPVSEFSKAEEDTLASALSKLSRKNLEKTPMSLSEQYKAQDTELLKLQILKLGKKNVDKNPLAKPQMKMEGLAALGKLKPTKRPPKLEQEVPEALRKFEKLKPLKKPITSSATKENEPTTATSTSSSTSTSTPKLPSTSTSEVRHNNFQDHLALILRTGSTSSFGGTDSNPEPVPLRRAQTDVEESKLTHPNKGRSRGPRRRLPKKATASVSPSNTVKRTPPPKREKPKTVGPLTPTRKFEGELFI
ncbi:uncharacterized protein KQ657_000648 [Scheffersomyces spartinae]|uniref:Uncharacterized protein n=1 Tax=Scheffersomyces spartinae TaxID=45513 RepID=A0A9P7V9A3_9ASCO|nr:uncharacterized protein KQ657_000648 [Scheffersomyces spartinae]KAG7193579.1 hypothetical protein KQ657_000648 [Scheffersomyces spartinae]